MLITTRQLKKPRRIEQTLLDLFLEFYEAWVYKESCRVRDQSTVNGTRCAAVFSHVEAIRDTLNRASRNYCVYREALHTLKEKHFCPVMMPVRRDMEISEREPALRPEGNFF